MSRSHKAGRRSLHKREISKYSILFSHLWTQHHISSLIYSYHFPRPITRHCSKRKPWRKIREYSIARRDKRGKDCYPSYIYKRRWCVGRPKKEMPITEKGGG